MASKVEVFCRGQTRTSPLSWKLARQNRLENKSCSKTSKIRRLASLAGGSCSAVHPHSTCVHSPLNKSKILACGWSYGLMCIYCIPSSILVVLAKLFLKYRYLFPPPETEKSWYISFRCYLKIVRKNPKISLKKSWMGLWYQSDAKVPSIFPCFPGLYSVRLLDPKNDLFLEELRLFWQNPSRSLGRLSAGPLKSRIWCDTANIPRYSKVLGK